MWMLWYKNKETDKTIWETGFGWYILRRMQALYEDKSMEVLHVCRMDFSWKSLVSCFFGYDGVIDTESMAMETEGKVE